jgi:hypothetical protein
MLEQIIFLQEYMTLCSGDNYNYFLWNGSLIY